MKTTEICLDEPRKLPFRGESIGVAAMPAIRGRGDYLRIDFESGSHLELPAAIDVSEKIPCARVFVLEGTPDDTFILFGGEIAYWLSTRGQVKAELKLFRKLSDAEYWATNIVFHNDVSMVIYEAGVCVLDQSLHVLWHKPKFINDEFSGMDDKRLEFVRDHDTTWYMLLKDGSSST